MKNNIKTNTAGHSPQDRQVDLVGGSPANDSPAQSNVRRARKPYDWIKRTFDIMGAMTALVLLAPTFFAIAIMIKLSSPGPIIFRQRRIGQFGKQFEFLKFRIMYARNDPSIHKEYVTKLLQEGSAVYKIQNDPRVTPIGRFLRKFSLDELPQFINVLRGEMSLVGPRPPITYEIEKYEPWHMRRLDAIPGLTGLWQVQGRSYTTFDEMIKFDIFYVEQRSFWLDLKILLKSPRAVFRGASRY